jgi:antitoxin FitA
VGSLTIRKLDDDIKTKLRLSAATKGISMEEEARRRLKESLAANEPTKPKPTAKSILEFGVKSGEPFDLKKFSDEMWDEVLDSHRP